MRENITTAPVFPGDAVDGAAVVGMMVGGAGPLGGVSRHLTYSLPKSAKAATISGSMTPSIDNPRKVFHAA